MPQRKQGFLQLIRLQAVQEIALVFVSIHATQQVMHAVAHFFARIMAGGNRFRAFVHRVIQKAFEFDFGIAQHIGIRRSAGLIFLQKIGEHFVFVLRGEVHDIDVDADNIRHGHRIQRILFDAAIFVVVVVFPVLHEHAAHVCTAAFEQRRGYR